MDQKTTKTLFNFLLHGLIFEIILIVATLITAAGHDIRKRIHDFFEDKPKIEQKVRRTPKPIPKRCPTGRKKSKKT